MLDNGQPKETGSVQLYNSDDPETVESLTAKLKSMKNSANRREQEIFPCMIQSLFDEYRFFPKYPEKELQVTAALFGGLINADLITGQKLGDALRLFLEAVRNPVGHKMCNFGIQALRPIMDRLPAWPQYCRNLLQAIPLFPDGLLPGSSRFSQRPLLRSSLRLSH